MSVSGTPSPRVTVRKILVAEDKEAPNVEISNWLHDVRNSGLDEEQGLPDIQCGHSGLRAPHERTLTDKERAYQLEIHGKEKREFETKLRKHIGIIYALFDSRVGHEVLDKEMENYNSRLRCLTQIAEGDSAGIQDFADFLVCSEGAMQSMQYMEELNSPWILQEISSKLPLRSGSRWCREAHDVLRKTNRTVSCHDLVVFVKEEADLANDPVFSPEALKRERNKMTDKNRGKRVQGVNSFVSLSSRTQSSESRRKSNEVEGQNSTQAFFPMCSGGHQPDKCGELCRGERR